MYASGIKSPEIHSIADKISLKIGILFGMYNDYSDVYMSEMDVGHIGTCDIAIGQFTWFVLMAHQLSDPDQRQLLYDNYGRNDDTAVRRVRQLYDELDLKAEFRAQESQILDELYAMIDKFRETTGLPDTVYAILLADLYRVKNSVNLNVKVYGNN